MWNKTATWPPSPTPPEGYPPPASIAPSEEHIQPPPASPLQRALTPLVFLLAAFIFTWPTLFHLTTSIPQGSETAPTVPLFNLWTLGWNVDRLQRGLRGYWQAPIFHPTPGAFAFSDPQPLSGLLAAPWWGISPALGYNLVLLLFLTLNGWSVYGLLRRRGVAHVPALLSGLLAQAIPYLARERGVLQLQPFFGMVWALEGLWKLISTAHWRWAAVLAAGSAVTFLTSEYFGLMLLVLLAPVALVGMWRRGRSPRFWAQLIAAGAALAVLTLPLLLPQRAILRDHGFSRSRRTIQRLSAKAEHYLRAPAEVLEGRLLFPDIPWGQRLFPGGGLILLGVAGSLIGLWNPHRRRWALFWLASGGLAFLLSLGFNLHLGDWYPYALLRSYLPGFENLRSPFRFALWVQLSLAFLAGITLSTLWDARRRRLALALSLICLLEIWPLPTPLTPLPPPLPELGLRSPVVFIPFVKGSSVTDYTETVTRMVQSLPVGVWLVNGYSGYFPPHNSTLKALLADFPSWEALNHLRALGVQTIVVRAEALTPQNRQRLENFVARGVLSSGTQKQGFWVYYLNQSRNAFR